jgi:hypothetical protein
MVFTLDDVLTEHTSAPGWRQQTPWGAWTLLGRLAILDGRKARS